MPRRTCGTGIPDPAPYFACLGALNNLNGSYGLGLNAVCNDLASVTSGLSAQGALNELLSSLTP